VQFRHLDFLLGLPLGYSNWGPEEPKNTPLENCVTMDMFTGKWKMVDCNNVRVNTMCEVLYPQGNFKQAISNGGYSKELFY